MSHPIHILIRDGQSAIIKDFKDWNEVYDFIGVAGASGDSPWDDWHASNGEEGRPGPKFVGGWIEWPQPAEYGYWPKKIFISAEELNRIPYDYRYCEKHNEYHTVNSDCPECQSEWHEQYIKEEGEMYEMVACVNCLDIATAGEMHHTEDGPMCDICYANTQEPTPEEE